MTTYKEVMDLARQAREAAAEYLTERGWSERNTWWSKPGYEALPMDVAVREQRSLDED